MHLASISNPPWRWRFPPFDLQRIHWTNGNVISLALAKKSYNFEGYSMTNENNKMVKSETCIYALLYLNPLDEN